MRYVSLFSGIEAVLEERPVRYGIPEQYRDEIEGREAARSKLHRLRGKEPDEPDLEESLC